MDLTQVKAVVFDLEGTLLDRKNHVKNLLKSNMSDFTIIWCVFNLKILKENLLS